MKFPEGKLSDTFKVSDSFPSAQLVKSVVILFNCK